MDRPNNGKTITIKINGKDRPFHENKEKENAQMPLASEKQQKKEETDFFGTFQTAAAQEADDDHFDWILPEETNEPELKEYKIASAPNKTKMEGLGTFSKNFRRKNRSGFIPSIFFAVFFAVLLGTSFGFIMLKLVNTENGTEITQPVTSEIPAGEETPSSAGSETYTLESLSTFVVQGGVYSSNEAAKQIQDTIIQKGVPSTLIDINGQTALYLGAADTIENAKEIGLQLKSKGIEVFAKPITIEGKALNDLNTEETKVLKAAPSLFETLSASASGAFVNNTIPAGLLDIIEKEGAALKEIDSDKLKNERIITIKGELDNAIKQVESYSKSPNAAVSTKLQQHLLDFLAAYNSL